MSLKTSVDVHKGVWVYAADVCANDGANIIDVGGKRGAARLRIRYGNLRWDPRLQELLRVTRFPK
jgi:hypothetical protein